MVVLWENVFGTVNELNPRDRSLLRSMEWYADQGAQPTSFGAKYLMTWAGLDRCATVGFRCVVDISF